jgi:hypothetical protein
LVAKLAVRPEFVVVETPGFDRLLRIDQAEEPALVQALVAEPPVEARRERVLNGLPGLYTLSSLPVTS